ncbi:MAG: hypothetical protein ACE5LH_01985 [Fidelibacterota bacterium]
MLVLALLMVASVGCTDLSETVTAPIEPSLTYTREIRPILERSCVRCHGGEVTSLGYDLSTYETAVDSVKNIIPGDPASRILVKTARDGNMYRYLNSSRESEMIYTWVVRDGAARD